MAKLDDILQKHSDSVDSIISEFTDKLQLLLDRASAKLTKELQSKLVISGGLVDSTSRNQSIIRGLDDRYMELLNAEGYDTLLENYVATFDGQFKWFDEVLANINGELVWPLPKPTFSRADVAEFNAYKTSSKSLLTDAVAQVAARAKKQAVLSTGGMPVKELTGHIAEQLGTSLAESENLAETSISSFYRTITDKGFQSIEEDLPGFEIRYNYEGPLDKLTRPFCTKLERLSRSGKTWTRAEINRLSNGQLPNVFVTGGGYRCRHQWVISISSLREQQRNKPRPESPKREVKRPDVSREIAARRAEHVSNFKGKTGVDHPHEQLQAIRASAEAGIKKLRAS